MLINMHMKIKREKNQLGENLNRTRVNMSLHPSDSLMFQGIRCVYNLWFGPGNCYFISFHEYKSTWPLHLLDLIVEQLRKTHAATAVLFFVPLILCG